MATTRTVQYFLDKFVSGYAVKAVDMQDLAASIPTLGAASLTAVNAAISALQIQIAPPVNLIVQSGAVTIADFTTEQKAFDNYVVIDVVIGDEATSSITFPTGAKNKGGNTFDENKTNIITKTWIKALNKMFYSIDKDDLVTELPGDTTAPTFAVNTVTSIGSTAATFNARINEAGTVKWMVTTSSTAPTKSAILAGTGEVGSNHGSISMVANTTSTASLSGLSATTAYYVWFYAIDSALNESTVQASVSFNTGSVADTTPPVYNLQTISAISYDVATYNVEINESGSVKWMLTASATPPTKSAILAGTGKVGSNFGSASVTANTPTAISLTGLTGATAYYLYSYAADAASNESNIQASVNFSTIADPVVFDNFNSSNVSNIAGRTLTIGGGTWVKEDGDGTIGIVSGSAKLTSGTYAAYSTNGGKNDVDIRVNYSAFNSSPVTDIRVKYQNSNNVITVSPVTGAITQVISGSPTTIFSGSGVSNTGNTIRVTTVGTKIKVFRGSTEITTTGGIDINGALTSQNIGFLFYGDTVTSLNDIIGL